VADGDNFTVTIPGGRPDTNYVVFGQCAGVTDIVGIDIPAADNTLTTFHVITTGATTPGDIFAFTVKEL
jgi:hypothetical protein